MVEIISPISLTNNISFVKEINKNKIIKAYRNYGIDISSYFKGIENVSIFKCNKTSYRFYHPFNLAGDSFFYEQLQQFEWYYMPWKWEHEIAKDYIKPDMRLLEVGCAHGAFIKRINELLKLDYTVGLELNESTIEKGNNFEIRNETIQSYTINNKDRFDIVCSFQVLEHITNVHDFLASSINCLKKGGILILSVPNNNSFLKDSDSCLNMPPHHMGLWNEDSLNAIADIFSLKLLNVHYEELQEYHVSSHLHSKYYKQYGYFLRKLIIRGHKILGIYQQRFAKTLADRQNIIGHTILITFEK